MKSQGQEPELFGKVPGFGDRGGFQSRLKHLPFVYRGQGTLLNCFSDFSSANLEITS